MKTYRYVPCYLILQNFPIYILSGSTNNLKGFVVKAWDGVDPRYGEC
jgi:hypothetical protein